MTFNLRSHPDCCPPRQFPSNAPRYFAGSKAEPSHTFRPRPPLCACDPVPRPQFSPLRVALRCLPSAPTPNQPPSRPRFPLYTLRSPFFLSPVLPSVAHFLRVEPTSKPVPGTGFWSFSCLLGLGRVRNAQRVIRDLAEQLGNFMPVLPRRFPSRPLSDLSPSNASRMLPGHTFPYKTLFTASPVTQTLLWLPTVLKAKSQHDHLQMSTCPIPQSTAVQTLHP